MIGDRILCGFALCLIATLMGAANAFTDAVQTGAEFELQQLFRGGTEDERGGGRLPNVVVAKDGTVVVCYGATGGEEMDTTHSVTGQYKKGDKKKTEDKKKKKTKSSEGTADDVDDLF